MRINKHLISKSTKRQEGDLEKELEALKRQHAKYFWSRLIYNIKNAVNKMGEWVVNAVTSLANALEPIVTGIKTVLKTIDDETFRQTTTEQLPELPKLQRFRDDLL
jgi:hypothetical protein